MGQLWGASWPQLRDICLSITSFLNLCLEKLFNYTCVSMENWLFLVILGLLLLLSSKKWPTMGLFDKPKASRSFQWSQMICLDTIWGVWVAFMGLIWEKKVHFWPKKPILKQLWMVNLIFFMENATHKSLILACLIKWPLWHL